MNCIKNERIKNEIIKNERIKNERIKNELIKKELIPVHSVLFLLFFCSLLSSSTQLICPEVFLLGDKSFMQSILFN